MNILLITQYFPPEMGAPQARLYELARRLVDKGHTVQVLTAMPNYPTGRIFKDYRGKLTKRENLDGIDVIRTTLFASKSQKALSRLLCYLTFAATALFIGGWRLKRPDLALIESPPLFLMPTGIILTRLLRAKTVMMVSDIWPDIIVRMGYQTGGFYLRALEWLECISYRFSDVVALTNPGAVRQINERFPKVKTTVISNGVDTALFAPALRSDQFRRTINARDDDFVVIYCGLHGMAQGLEVVIDAASRLKAEDKIRFVMIGDGPVKESLLKQSESKGLNNITFMDPKPKKEIPAILASCDMSLVPLLSRLPGTMPSKVYEALASGVPPMVAKGCEGEDLVEKHGAGMSFEPMDGAEMADKIASLARHPDQWATMRTKAIELSKRFDREVIADRTEQILKAIVEDRELPKVEW